MANIGGSRDMYAIHSILSDRLSKLADAVGVSFVENTPI